MWLLVSSIDVKNTIESLKKLTSQSIPPSAFDVGELDSVFVLLEGTGSDLKIICFLGIGIVEGFDVGKGPGTVIGSSVFVIQMLERYPGKASSTIDKIFSGGTPRK